MLKDPKFIVLSLWYYSAWFIGLANNPAVMNPLYLCAFFIGNVMLLVAIGLIMSHCEQCEKREETAGGGYASPAE